MRWADLSRLRPVAALAGASLLWVALAGCAPPPPEVMPVSELTPAEYQAQLAGTSATLGSALDQVANATSIPALTASLTEAQTAVADAMARLGERPPPVGAAALDAELKEGIGQFANDLSQLGDQVASLRLCGAPSVIATISNQESVNRLRATAAALATASSAYGYQWGEFLPPPTPLLERRLPNGQIVADHRSPGRDLFEVQNDRDRDAVIALVQAGNTIVSMYVAGHEKATLQRISNGGYEVYETSGVDWDPQLRTFTRECAFYRLSKLFEFNDQTSTYPVLHLLPTPTGDITAGTVDPASFPKG